MAKPRNAGFRPGDYWMSCDRCGIDYRQSQMKKEWNGLIVCDECWEPRHPQDFVRASKDQIATPAGFTRPEVGENLIEACSPPSARAGEAVAGCAIAGYDMGDRPEYSVPAGTFNTQTL